MATIPASGLMNMVWGRDTSIAKNPKGTVIGAVVGAAAGAGYAVATKDSDVRLPAGTHILITLNQRLIIGGN